MSWTAADHPRGADASNMGRFVVKARSEADVTLAPTADWPTHTHETRPWKSAGRGPREDRMFTEVEVSIPPFIADLNYQPAPHVAAALEEAAVAAGSLDLTFGEQMSSFGTFLLRTESVASSRIERVNATMDDLAKAVVGVKASESARATVAAVRALTTMVTSAGDKGRIDLDDLLTAHHELMKDDPTDARYAGTLRDVQNWIGGSDYSPRGAVHVPPPPELVPELMADLLEFANRRDMTVLMQAAIAHAQFESIHPFTDGNGRIGRALINSIMRTRGITTHAVVPVASAMVADVDHYFALVNGYRHGAVGPFVAYLADATSRSARQARVSAVELAALPSRWRERVRPRGGSAAAKLIDTLLEHPVLDADSAARLVGASASSTYAAIEHLVTAGVLHPITASKRNLAWAATDVMDEIESLNIRLRTP